MILQIIKRYIYKKYDFKAFFLLGLRLLFPFFVRKQDIRGISGSFLCTELITDILLKEEKLITPYGLFQLLNKDKK